MHQYSRSCLSHVITCGEYFCALPSCSWWLITAAAAALMAADGAETGIVLLAVIPLFLPLLLSVSPIFFSGGKHACKQASKPCSRTSSSSLPACLPAHGDKCSQLKGDGKHHQFKPGLSWLLDWRSEGKISTLFLLFPLLLHPSLNLLTRAIWAREKCWNWFRSPFPFDNGF